MIASTHVEVPAPFPAIVGTATLDDNGGISFVGDDGSPLASGLVPVYEAPYGVDDLAAAMNAGAITCTSRIVALNGSGAVEIKIMNGDQLIATVTNPT